MQKRYVVGITEGSIYRGYHFNNRQLAESKYDYLCTLPTGRVSFSDLKTREYFSQNNLFKENQA